MASDVVWFILGAGAIAGFYIGRWWAENGRARADMRRVWESRKNYRL